MNRKKKGEAARESKTPQPAAPAPAFDFSFGSAAKLFPPTLKDPKFYLVGGGGNGSYLALHLGRLSYILRERGQNPEVVFIDPDVVERKNVGRQNFCQAEIGEYKCVTLARRFEEAFGINASAIPEEFTPSMVEDESGRLIALVGCVDNAPAREQISRALDRLDHSYHTPAALWLDCGNHRDTGQVIIGTTNSKAALSGSFPLPGVCTALPSPAVVMPDLLRPERDERAEKLKMSCAELALLNDQSPAINSAMADHAAAYLFNLFVYGELKAFKTEVNLRHINSRSYYITKEAVGRAAGVPAETLSRTQDPRAVAFAA